MLKKFLKNKKISWKHTKSNLKSSKLVNLKVDILSSYEVKGGIETKSKYIHFLSCMENLTIRHLTAKIKKNDLII